MSRVVVVGAGLGGLAAAARLAAAGHDVTVVEQSDAIGGKLGTFRRDGFTFDTGPSLLTMPYVLEDLFAATGDPLASVLPLQPLETACRYRFPDGTVLDMPGDAGAIGPALDTALGPGRGAQWSTFLDRAERIWDATHEPFLESPITLRDMARLSRRLTDVRDVAPWQTLRGLGASYLHDPRLRQLLDRYATYTGSDPRRAPAALATVPYVEQAHGSWHVPGGLHRIAETVRDRAVERGATVRLSTEVVEVVTAAGRACGVRLADGELLAADVVVAGVDAAQLYGRLVPPDPRAWRTAARLDRSRSLSGFVLLLATDALLYEHRHHQVLFTDDYDAEFDGVLGPRGRRRPVEAPTVYVSSPGDPAMAPDGAEGLFVLVNAAPHDPRGGVDWDEPGLADEYAEHVLDTMARRGFDVRPHLRWREVRTPADLGRATLTGGGAIYGSSSNGPRSAFLRPANRSPVPGLFLVGGSAHPGGGLPLVMLSAEIVSGLVGPS
ncbi:phytoene desaturase family protein [Aeromicrobium chenweiae]|uniref:Phytoene desaturase n=1 Tax=Aeromicrobium chenweiae TaxID=2079793 RepID=A0A2S0WHY2_9ACTN|nr:phytoene desaturase family protein [Aeromicrobium chenweiae]AWB90933.1 phytoene desaturase [Aeromicrobium chenweiae]TGN32153.1 phytoene desaturase [Aeromicrobium chenweiae]